MTKNFKITAVFLLIIGVLTILVVNVFLYINPPVVPQNDQWKDPRLFGREIVRPKNQPESKLIPNFNDIRAVAYRNISYRGEEKWIAGNTVFRIDSPAGIKVARFFTQQYGLAGSMPTDIINHKDQIWVGFQGGVSKYIDNADEFKIYLEGESNVKLFEDPYEKKLYAATFRNFFYYDDTQDRWEVDATGSAPINSNQLVFTEKNIFGSSYPTALPVVVFDKEKNVWEKSSIPEFGDQQGLTLFKAGSRVFIYGRNKDYSSCEDSGKQSASVFFEFKDGKWESNEELNRKFYNNEPSILGDKISKDNKITFAYEDPQCNSDKRIYKKAEFNFSNDKVALVKEETRDTSFLEDGKFSELAQEISSLLKLPTYRKVKAVDDWGNIYVQSENSSYGYTTKDINFSIIKNSEFGRETKVILNPDQLKDFSSSDLISPIFCRTKGKTLSTYALIQSVNEMGGETTKAKLFKIDSDQTHAIEVNQIKEETLKTIDGYGNYGSGLVCQNETFYWLSEGADEGKIQTLDLNNFQLSQIAVPNQQKIIPLYDIGFSDQTRLWFTDDKQISLFYFDATNSQTKEVKTDFSKRTLASGKGLAMIFADKDRIWFYETEEAEKPKSQIIITDLAGNKVKSFQARGYNFDVTALSNGYFVGSNSEGVFTFNYGQDNFNYIDQEKLPFWGTPTNFMPSKIVFKLFSYNDKVWFDGADAGAFFLDYKDLGIPVN